MPASIYVAQAVELVPAVSGATAKGFLDFLADTLRAESVRPESMRPQQSLQAMNAIADGVGLLVKGASGRLHDSGDAVRHTDICRG